MSSKFAEILSDMKNKDKTISENRFLTDNLLQSLFNDHNCVTVADLQKIGRTLGLETFEVEENSYKCTYRNLAKSIHDEFGVNFAMVEGLHRMYTVRNILEGNFLPGDEDEPNTSNRFLQTKVSLRINILDVFSIETLAPFQQLSLFTEKVKKSSLERTLFDELCQLAIEMEHENKIVDLLLNSVFASQPGRPDTESNHVLYQQRLFLYKFICSFAFNNNKSTVLYRYQHDHITVSAASKNIPNKHQFLGIAENTNLHDGNLFLAVANGIMNVSIVKKAENFSMLCTKSTTRNLDLYTKPISQDLRIVLSYYNLASINMDTINQATRVFSYSYPFVREQKQDREIPIRDTMFQIVTVIDELVSLYRKAIDLASNRVHASKLEQLIQMNVFHDILTVLEDIGHNPNLPENIAVNLYQECEHTMEDQPPQESVFNRLLTAWKSSFLIYLENLPDEFREAWKTDILKVCQGEKGTTQNLRYGEFGNTNIQLYTINKNILFSSYFQKLESGLCPAFSAFGGQESDLESEDSIDKDPSYSPMEDCAFSPPTANNEVEFSAEPPGFHDIEVTKTVVTEKNMQIDLTQDVSMKKSTDGNVVRSSIEIEQTVVQNDTPKSADSKRKRRVGIHVEEKDVEKKKKASPKKTKIDKNSLAVPEEVLRYYNSVVQREGGPFSINRDMTLIKKAWIMTANDLKKGSDLSQIWVLHQGHIVNLLESTNA